MTRSNRFWAGILGAFAVFLLFLSFPIHSFASGELPLDTIEFEDPSECVEEEWEEEIPCQITVYCPKKYTAKQKYDVLYVLEGLNSTENEALTASSIQSLEEMFSFGFEGIIVVVVPHQVYRKVSFPEIVKRVDEAYSTNKSSSGRIVAGFSNGAYYIWNVIFSRPSCYLLADTYIPMSPIGAKEMILGNFNRIQSCADRIRIYNTCGDEGAEADYMGLYSGEEQMEAILENAKGYGFIENQNIFFYQAYGGHNWEQCYNALAAVLPRILERDETETGG